jgi:hypothetical protein
VFGNEVLDFFRNYCFVDEARDVDAFVSGTAIAASASERTAATAAAKGAIAAETSARERATAASTKGATRSSITER